jgi:Flp pilus assembly protein TadD/spermidine synthase
MARAIQTETTQPTLLITALATVFCSSAAIMLLQLVASRLTAAYLGQSLYTWTSAIGVTLAGIALGNALGGRLADRAASARTLGLQLLASAVCVLAVLALNPLAGALPPLVALPWPARIFLHMALVFLLPFTVLGTISPVIAKLALGAGGPAGGRIGSVFAWSITGSLLGVFVTGYFLLAFAGNRAVLVCAALILAALGATLLARGRAAAPFTASADPVLPVPFRLILLVFIAGALIMMIELSAARMLSRVYGSSLFTWTTTIGVILAAMAAGGHFGGRWADRYGAQRTLTGVLVGVSAACAALPLLHNVLYRFPLLWGLPWPMQILAHTLLVFALPCFLLGAAPPAAVRQAVAGNAAAGRAVGALYAWNSAGSILGAFLTGYVLIAALGTVQVICITFLSAAALAVFASPKSTPARAWGAAALLLGLAAFVPLPPFNAIGLNLALRPYRAPETVFERESAYSYIAINEVDPDEDPGVRSFVLDKLVHNKADINAPLDLKYPYLSYYAAALDALYPAGAPLDTLSIGGGGYNFITYLEMTRPGGKTVAVEIDPEVTEAAHAAFGFPRDTRAVIHHMDGRNFIDQEARRGADAQKYDAIFGDCLSDYTVPFHLTTVEYVRQLAALLKDDGVYMLNMLDMYEVGNFLAAVTGTCAEVFPHVYVFSPTGKLDARETYVVVASKRAIDLAPATAAVNAKTRETGRLLTAEELGALRARAPLAVLTDDFAPVENLLAPVVLRTEESTLFRRLVRADHFMTQGQYAKAAREAQIIIEKSKNFPEAVELFANASAALGDHERGLAALRGLVKEHPENAEYHDKLAVHLFRASKPQEALAEWQAALAADPKYARATMNLGVALFQLKRFDEAEPHLRAAALAMPNNEEVYTNLAGFLFMRGDAAGAIATLRDAAVRLPQSGAIQHQLAIAAYKSKDYETAWQAVHAAQRLGADLGPDLVRDLQRDSGRAN